MDNCPSTTTAGEPGGNRHQEQEPSPSRLRRVVSLRALDLHIDSSESAPSDHDSIYNGILASFDSKREDAQLPGADEAEIRAATSSGLQRRASNASGSSVSHSGWPPRTLETIVERCSASTLHRSLTVSHADLDGSSGVSNKSRTSVPSWHCQNLPVVRRNIFGCKIYSFDDLDIPAPRPKIASAIRERRDDLRSSSSSSDTILQIGYRICTTASPAAPGEPLYPPPKRTPTPPGIPSFGSREAMRYTLSPESRNTPATPQTNNSSAWTCRISRGSAQNGDGDVSGLLCCGIRIRYLLGLDNPSLVDTNALPQGAIARADDGTVVRGRWGARQSGHGVGAGPAARGLANHPFHRANLPVASAEPAENPSWVTRSLRGLNLPGPSGGTPASSPTVRYLPSTYTSGNNQIRHSPQARSQPRVQSLIDAASPTVPVPAHIERRSLKTPWPRASPGESALPQDDGNGATIGPFHGTNDGPAFAPVQTTPSSTPLSVFPNEWSYFSSQGQDPHETKPMGLWDWIWVDCFVACCGVNEDESLHELHPVRVRRQNESAYGTIDVGDGPVMRPIMSYPDNPRDGSRHPSPRPNNLRSSQRGIIGSGPWSPAWGWRPRCFGGDATADDD